jgi:hypothetical protein
LFPLPVETEIVRKASPEEGELTAKKRELALLLVELEERELSLASLKAELAAFEGQYLREVGTLYAELDEWQAKIAELIATLDGSCEAQAAASEARQQAQETYAAAHGETSNAAEFTPSPELKKLFKEVAKAVHPDRASGQDDRILRERLMKEATEAFSRADAAALQGILDEYKSSPESVAVLGIATELKRIALEIMRVRKRLVQIDLEIAELAASPMAMLLAKRAQLQGQGRELFTELAADVRRRIDAARQHYEALAESRSSL